VSDPSSPRLAPLAPDDCGDDVRAALGNAFGDETAARFLGSGPDAMAMPNVLATLMHHPALAGPFLTYNNVLLRTPVLEPRLRELMVLRVAWRTRARYEWAQHVRLAARAGITPDEIDAVTRAVGTEAKDWAPLEADLLAATDQLIDSYRIDDDTWGRLAKQLDEAQLVELVFVVGTYTGLAMAFNSFGLELDPELGDIATATQPHFEE
jgi:4-carboxymuconolactone decarboxylase